MQEKSLVLEIFKAQGALKMCVFEQQEIAQTLRHYTQLAISFQDVDTLRQEISAILERAQSRSSLDADLLSRLKRGGQFLWDHLLTKPTKDKLKATPGAHLLLSIDEELVEIPWELLYDGNDFLCLKFNLGRLIRTHGQTQPAVYRSLSGTPKMLILANPTADLSCAYLEGLAIKNQFDKKRKEIRIDFKSTDISTLYVKKNLRDYDLVHFAGHCEFNAQEPQRSGWVLRDGYLTAQDILSLGETLSLPTIIFSHACHSATTSPDLSSFETQKNTYGLAVAFLLSGVRHYIGAIRKIEDEVGLHFAKQFYTRLISGCSVGESLRLARLSLMKEYGPTTFFWTSYLLYGDPNFSLWKAAQTPGSKKPKLKVAIPKKVFLKAALACLPVFIILYLYIRLPTLNPNAFLLYGRSRSCFLRGDNQEVISICTQIIKKEPGFLAAYPLLADTYYRLGDKESALKYYFEYARACEKKPDKKNLSSAYTGIGWIYHLQGDYQKAIDFYNRAVALCRDQRDSLNEARALERLAVWHIDQRDNDKALELLMQSSQINRERQQIREHKYGLACDYFDIALVFTNKDDFKTAKEFYTRSRQLFEQLNMKHELSDYYFNLGEIHLFEKEYQKALDCYMKGLAIDEQEGHLPNIASDYNMLGELYVEMDNLNVAENYFHQAISVCRQIDAPLELAAAYSNLGRLYKQKGEKNKSLEYLRSAQEIYWNKDKLSYEEVKKELLELGKSSAAE